MEAVLDFWPYLDENSRRKILSAMRITDGSLMEFERSLRGAVVEEAETWLKTPYHHMGRIKSVGVDCLTLLAEVYEACGIIPHIELEFYPPDWNLHRDAERYLAGVMRHAVELEGRWAATECSRTWEDPTPQPGDVAVFKFGRCFAHGAIITEWPSLIHSWVGVGVLRGDAAQPPLAGRAVRFFDPFVSSVGSSLAVPASRGCGTV